MFPVQSMHLQLRWRILRWHLALQTLPTQLMRRRKSLQWMWRLVLTTRPAMKNDSGGRPVACKGTMWTPRLPTAANIAFHFQHNHRQRRVTLNINIARGTTYPGIDSVTRGILIEYSATWIICKFGHQVAPLAWLQLVATFSIKDITPGHGADFWVRCASGNASNFGHQVALHALVVNLSKSWHL